MILLSFVPESVGMHHKKMMNLKITIKVLKPQDFMLVVTGILMLLQMIPVLCLFRIGQKKKQKHSRK